MLMTTANVYRGLLLAVDTSLATRSDDIDLRLLGLAPTEPLLERARAVPGVALAEAWGHVLATVGLEGAGELVGTGRYSVLAPPADTKLFDPVVAEGRWPQPDEQGAVVVSRNLQAAEPGLELGARRNLVVAGRATPVEVVGGDGRRVATGVLHQRCNHDSAARTGGGLRCAPRPDDARRRGAGRNRLGRADH